MSTPIAHATRNTIADAMRRAAARHRDKEALLFGERTWSFRRLEAAANHVAGALARRGLEPGDRVAALGRNSDAYLILWLACHRAGLIHVPINYALKGEELGYIVRQAGARALLHDSALADALGSFERPASLQLVGTIQGGGGDLDILDLALAAPPDATPPAGIEARDDDVAQILYTSGTTAAPKGAMLSHRALQAEYASCIIHLELAETDRALAGLPLYHSAQMHAFTMPQLLMGATTTLIDTPKPDLVLELIERERITSFFAPPTLWIALLRHPDMARRDLTSLRNVYYGASIMPGPIVQELRERLPGVRLYNCYGQSEIAPLATVLSPEDHDRCPTSAGKPVLHVETRIVDEAMRDVPTGELGEIVHRSPQLLLGYWRKPEETAEAFRGGWFHSGDLGRMDAEGFIYIVDRVKDVVNSGGVIISSREVEEALYTHEAVSEVAVIALPHERWIEAVTAVVVRKDGAELDEEALLAHARARLAAFKVPKAIFFVDALPANASGKVLKRALRERFRDALAATTA